MLKKETTTVASSNPKISTKRGVGFGDSVIYRSHMVGQKICGLLLKLSDRSVEEGMPSCSLIKSLISPFNQTHNEY